MVSELEVLGVVLGILGLGIAGYQIYLQLERRGRDRNGPKTRDPGVPPSTTTSSPTHHLPESAPLPAREVHLRERIGAEYGRWVERNLKPGPAGASALAVALRKGDVLRGDVESIDGLPLDIHVLDEENYRRWRDREGFDQLDGADQVFKRSFKLEVPADGEIVVALLFASDGAGPGRVRLLALRKTQVRVKRKSADPGI